MCGRSASSSSATPRTRCRRSSRSATTCSISPRSRRRASASCSPGSSTSTTVISRRSATRPRASAAACPRWRCSATSWATTEVVRIANARAGEGFVAVSAEARKKFWLDRKRTAAISKHTNAFKINEDVVIPLPRMGEYTEGIERINIELSLANKLALVDRLEAFFLSGSLPLGKSDDAGEIASAELLEDRVQQALAVLREVGALWRLSLIHISEPTRLLS